MRTLFLSPRQCWPTRSGAKLREFHIARALGERGDLTYVYFSDPDSEPLTRADLPFCKEIVAVPKPGTYTPSQMLRGLAGRWPLPVLNYTNPVMDAAVLQQATKANYDLIHADSIHMVRYARAARRTCGARIVYDWHNIESEAMRRFAATVESLPRRWYAVHTAGKLEALEREILPEALGHIVCSARERDDLLRWCPTARIHVAENGVDLSNFPGAASGQRHPSLLFVGSMDYFPNIDAVLHFAREVWPTLRQKLPQLTLTIVGARPTSDVQALGEAGGITVTGTVPDVRPFYSGALAAIVPLRTGGGTRLKILEAMAAGVPVISTELGAEGLDATPGVHLLLASSEPDSWVQQIRSVMEKTRRDSLVAGGLALVRDRYDWNRIGRDLAGMYESWLRLDH